MNIEMLHFIFLINYIYLIIVLARQGWRDYCHYLIILSLAAMASVAAWYFDWKNLPLSIFCSLLFVALTIVPLLLSRYIVTHFPRGKIDAIVRCARWRYLLTLCRAYRMEYLVFQCWQLVSARKFQKAIATSHSLFAKVSEAYWPLIYQIQACAYSRIEDWEKTIGIYREHLTDYPTPLVLTSVIEACCYRDDIQQAMAALIQLESHPEKKYLAKQLAMARLLVHAHAGNCEKVNQLLPLAGQERQAAYWLAIASAVSGAKQQAENYLAVVKGDDDDINNRKLQLVQSRINQETTPSASQPGKLYSSLELWEKESSFASEPMAPAPWVTRALIGINIIFFLFMEWHDSAETLALFLLNLGANSFEFVAYEHQYWRLVSSMFLHFGYLHLFFNLYALHFFGSFVERYYGRRVLVILYMFCGIVASLISIAWRTSFPALSLGASGAICGLMGVNTYFFIFRGRTLVESIRRHYVFSFLFMIISLALLGHFVPHIDNAAHFGGIFCGLVLGALFKSHDHQHFPRKIWSRFGRQLALILALAVLAFSFWQQISNYLFSPYPQQPASFVWYQFFHRNKRMTIALPFTWKRNKKMESVHIFSNISRWRLPPKSAPVRLPASKNLFWDYYNVSEQGMLTISFTTNVFSLPFIYSLFSSEEIIDNIQKSGKHSGKFSPPQPQKVGTNTFWLSRYRFSTTINCSKKSMIVLYYYLRIGNEIYQLAFRLPPEQLPRYRRMIERILATVSIQTK